MGRKRGWDQPEHWGEELGEGSAWGGAGGGSWWAGELARGALPDVTFQRPLPREVSHKARRGRWVGRHGAL